MLNESDLFNRLDKENTKHSIKILSIHSFRKTLSIQDDKEDRRKSENTKINVDKDQISTGSNKILMQTLFTHDTLFK